jgi:predicted CXXCH cytochrome family protein
MTGPERNRRRRAGFGTVLAAALLALFTLSVANVPAAAQRLSVTESVHDLSPSGPGTVKAATGFACFFCHAPHNVLAEQTPLWNQQLSTQVYTPYTSTSYQQTGAQPLVGSPSKLCLSCHDGTVALGQTVSEGLIPVSGGLGAASNLGVDMRSSHPYSFATPIVDTGELRATLFGSPAQTGDPLVRLVQGRVECTTCHDPHTPNLDPVVQKFLVRDSSNGQLCLACHDPGRPTAIHLRGWATGQHALATNSTGGNAALGGYATVAGNACVNCHVPHNANPGGRLLRQTEEATCAACHGGQNLNPVLPNVTSSFEASLFRHPVQLVGAHDPNENAFPLNSSRHSECADCHNPHAAQSGAVAQTPPASQPALTGASGVAATDGTAVLRPASNQFEVCFKCHANSTNKPQSPSYFDYGRTPYRQTFPTVADPYNVRLDFQSPVARHNVTQAARAGASPSLRTNMLDLNGSAVGRSLAVGSYLYCTDCHNHDAARALGGTAANGPHGSRYNHILERRYEFEPLPASPGASGGGVSYASGLSGPYALCDKCHDVENQLLNTDAVFGEHDRHVRRAQTSCATCHAPHGIQGGTVLANSRLINFDTNIVGPDRQGRLMIDTATKTCFLRCHNKNHSGTSY